MQDCDLLFVLIGLAKLCAWGLFWSGLIIGAALTEREIRKRLDDSNRIWLRLIEDQERLPYRRPKAGQEIKESLEQLREFQSDPRRRLFKRDSL